MPKYLLQLLFTTGPKFLLPSACKERDFKNLSNFLSFFRGLEIERALVCMPVCIVIRLSEHLCTSASPVARTVPLCQHGGLYRAGLYGEGFPRTVNVHARALCMCSRTHWLSPLLSFTLLQHIRKPLHYKLYMYSFIFISLSLLLTLYHVCCEMYVVSDHKGFLFNKINIHITVLYLCSCV